MSSKLPSLTVVVPAYAEEATIGEALARLHKILTESEIDFDIVLVVDGMVDKTELRARELNLERLSVFSYQQNQGKGFAIREGAKHITGSYAAFIDADLDIDATCLVGLFNQLLEENVDVVVGSKVHPSSIVHYPSFRRFQSRIMRYLVRFLFSLDIGDTQTGIKVFRSFPLLEALKSVQSNGFSFDVDLLVKLHDMKYSIIEGPIILNFQFTSTTKLSSSFEVLRDLLRLRIHRGVFYSRHEKNNQTRN